jgi:predicted nucleotidyltransferase
MVALTGPDLLAALADHFENRRPVGVISAYLFGSQATGRRVEEDAVLVVAARPDRSRIEIVFM